MNQWAQICAELREARERFPDATLQAVRDRVPNSEGDWSRIETWATALADEFEREVESAIEQFAVTRTWPEHIAPPARMFIAMRLSDGAGMANLLGVPFTLSHGLGLSFLQPPPGVDRAEITRWLLSHQWRVAGQQNWMAELRTSWAHVERSVSKLN